VVDTGDTRAALLRGFGDYSAECAERSRDDNDFSVHNRFSATGQAKYTSVIVKSLAMPLSFTTK
jgi:hypothetical protein